MKHSLILAIALAAASSVAAWANDFQTAIDRFARAEYTRLFPRHWHQLQYLRSTTELEQQLAAFWALSQ